MIEGLRLWFTPDRIRGIGTTPDYRFSLANERTFLAWTRTALALTGGGLAVAQFLDVSYLREGVAVALLLLGAVCALRGMNHWIRNELAMRRGEDLPQSRFPAALTVGIALGAAVLIVIVLAGGLG